MRFLNALGSLHFDKAPMTAVNKIRACVKRGQLCRCCSVLYHFIRWQHKSPDKVTVSIPETKDPWVNLSHVAAINFIGVSHFAIAPFPHSFTYF